MKSKVTPKSEKKFGYRDTVFFLPFLRPIWKLWAISLFLALITTALSSLLPLSGKVLIDFVVTQKGFEGLESLLSRFNSGYLAPFLRSYLESINWLVFFILLTGITAGLLGLIQRLLTFRFQQELLFSIQTRLFEHILRFPIAFFKQRQSGYLVSRVQDDIAVLRYPFSESIPHTITGALYLIFALAILFILSQKLFLITISILPACGVINYLLAGRLRDISHAERESYSQVSKDLQEVLSGVEVIKTHTSEEREARRVSERIRGVIQTGLKGKVLALLADYSSRGIQLFITAVIMWFGAREILTGSMTIGDYVAFTGYILYLSGSINALSLFHLTLQPVFASLDRIRELFKMAPELNHEGSPKLKRPDSIKGDIIFKDVYFSYEKDRPVLKDLSFHVQPGEVVALVGHSGAGKTTMINLLLRFYTAQSGTIFIDGHDLRELDTRWLRRQIGVVSQEVFLFGDTVEKNIRYSNPQAARQEVIDAARMSHIHEDIVALPEGYETIIGEKGARLSAGQKQRISIARAFLKKPSILIFDEPTSALDEETERLLKESLRKLFQGWTTFIISHRHSMLEVANRIFILKDGGIEERRVGEVKSAF